MNDDLSLWAFAERAILAVIFGVIAVVFGRNVFSRSNRALSSDKVAVADDRVSIQESAARGTLIEELVKQSQAAWRQVDAIKNLHLAALDEMADIRSENIEIRKENEALKADNTELRALHQRCETETNQLRAAHGVEIAALHDQMDVLRKAQVALGAKVDGQNSVAVAVTVNGTDHS